MKKKRTKTSLNKKMMSLMTALLVMLATLITPITAQADNTPVNGGTTTFNKYLVMNSDANVPPVTFSFSIVAGDAVENTAIVQGINPEAVQINPVSFTPGDNTTAGMPTDQEGSTTTDKKYATKAVTVDFSKVSFNAPGIYRYIITESNSSQDGIKNDITSKRTLDVYVFYADGSEDQLEVENYVLYSGIDISAEDLNKEASKSDSYTNTYTTNNLTLTKDVTGNQGDRDKYFKFTVEITGAVEGTKYDVISSENSDITIQDGNGAYGEGVLTATDGSVKFTCQLKDNDSITIKGLTAATNYTITETSYAADGYTTSNSVDSTLSTDTNTTGTNTMGTEDHSVLFTNNRQGSVPTGILLDVAPYLILGAVVIVGFAALFVSRRRRAR